MHDPDGPAEIRMMGIVHSALRRDLRRARLVLDEPDVPEARRMALADHLGWLVQFLDDHHRAEDTGLFPLALGKDPSLGPLLDTMDDEHRAIHPAMAQLTQVAAEWRTDPSAAPRVMAAVEQLWAVLTPHLRHEEEQVMPLVERAVTQREWHDWDQAANVRARSMRDLAFVGHWLIDGAGPEDQDAVVHEVPAVPRFVLRHLLGGAYRRRCRALWSGSPAAEVPSLDLSRVDA